MVTKEQIEERLKSYHVGLWFLAVFFISILFLVYISRFIPEGTFSIGANVNYSDNNPQYFSVYWAKFLQIICLGLVFGVIYYILMRIMLSKVDKDKGRNKYYVYLLEISVLILIVINCWGHLLHLGFEGVNAIDASEGEALNSEYKELFVYAWYMDEWLGHTSIHISYFGYLVLALLAELLLEDQKKLEMDELFFTFLFAIAIGILDGNIGIKSESGLFLLIIHIIFTASAILIILIKKVDPRRYPILLAMLLSLVFVIYFNLEVIFTQGISARYPFY